MIAVTRKQPITIEDYLAGELVSPIKHEYLGGFVYAMAGAKNAHNLVASNTLGSLHGRLRGSSCRPYNSDTKVRIRLPEQTRFYYPDVSIICRSNSPSNSFQDEPVLIVEVLSASTRRIDLGEKKDAYLTIPSLKVYMVLEQDCAAAVIFRRGAERFEREDYEGLDAIVPLPELKTELPLAEIYDGLEFVPETSEAID